jgi:hypothetical protein
MNNIEAAIQGLEVALHICERMADGYDEQSESKYLTESGKTLYQGMYGGARNCRAAILSAIEEMEKHRVQS